MFVYGVGLWGCLFMDLVVMLIGILMFLGICEDIGMDYDFCV